MPGLQLYGDKKCVDGDVDGRWVDLDTQPCSPPLCTGDRKTTVNAMDWVCVPLALQYLFPNSAYFASQDGKFRNFVWVPYSCFYHLYSKDDFYRCVVLARVSVMRVARVCVCACQVCG